MRHHILNIEKYNNSLHKSMYDKLFFAEVIKDSKIFFDLGCADGALIEALRQIYPDSYFFGYDNNEHMLARCNIYDNTFYSNDIELVMNRYMNMQDDDKAKSTLILSSVVHEMNTYLTTADYNEMWKFILKTGFNYITFRDMAIQGKDDWTRKTVMLQAQIARIRRKAEEVMPIQLREFEHYWGHLEQGCNYIHFLLKYMYKENWDSEIYEDYLLNAEQMEKRFQTYGEYQQIYRMHGTLPYLLKKWKEDWAITTLNPKTHLKMIYKRI